MRQGGGSKHRGDRNTIEFCDGTKIPILYEDRNILAIDKPSGWMLAPNNWVNTSRNLQLALESSMMGGDFWAKSRNLRFIRYIHRLDADASGILLMARNQGVLNVFSKLFEERRVLKKYYAVVQGIPKQEEWECELPLSTNVPVAEIRANRNGLKAFQERKIRAFVDPENGKEAKTHFKLLATNGKRSLVEAEPLTGRTHQIRVHLQAAGCPIGGDPLYIPKADTAAPDTPKRQRPTKLALRAVYLQYRDPFQHKDVTIKAATEHFLRIFGMKAEQTNA